MAQEHIFTLRENNKSRPIVKTVTEQGITGDVMPGKVSPLAMDTKGYTNGKINNTYERISYLYVRSKVVYPVMASHTHIVAITTQNIASAPL